MKDYFDKDNIRRLLKYGLFMFLALVAQNMVFTEIRPMGVCPMVLPAVAVAVGMFEGATFGAIFSLIMGLFADMSFVENTVLFTVLFPALAFASGFVAQFFINRRFFAYMLATLFASLITAGVQMFFVGASDSWSGAMISTGLTQTLWSMFVAPFAYLPPAKWIE